MVYSGLNVIFSRKYNVFVDVLERVVLVSKHNIDGKEDIENMIGTRTKTLSNYIRGIIQILLFQSEICHIFHYHVKILLKVMTDFITELVKIVHFFSIITSFSVQAMRS